MSLISKETLMTHLQRAEMASDVRLPIEFFRDLVYQAMPRTWVGLTDDERINISYKSNGNECVAVELTEAKLKEKNFD
jgi:hypothetical protein